MSGGGRFGPFLGGLAYDPIRDEVWVVDISPDNRNIERHARDGSLLGRAYPPIHPKSVAAPPKACTGDPAIDARTGNLWIPDGGLVVYDVTSTGKLAGHGWIFEGPSLFSAAWRPETNTVLTSTPVSRAVREYRTDGTLLRKYCMPQQVGGVTALAYNPVKSTLLVTPNADFIHEVELGGKVVRSWEFFKRFGIKVLAIALDTRSGSVFVGDARSSRVFEFKGMIDACEKALVRYGTACPDSSNTLPILRCSDCPKIGATVTLGHASTPGSQGIVVYALGATRAAIDLGRGCRFLTTPAIVLASVKMANGRSGVVLPIPGQAALRGLKVNVHALALEMPSGHLSVPNAVEMTLR